VLLLHFIATNVYPAIWAYYTIYRYEWTTWDVGLSLAAYGVIASLVQGGLVGPLIARLGERNASLVGLASELVVGLLYAFATQGWMIYVLILLGALQGIAHPAITAMMTREVGDDEQGELQGGISSLMGISSIVGPIFATQLFGAFSGQGAVIELPGMPFIAAALLSAAALWLFAGAPRTRRPHAASTRLQGQRER
jgi:DHA1 family tetracycline resistance protein-like MFS transporter